MTSSLMNRYYKGSAIEYDEQNAVKNGKTKIRNLFYCQKNSHYKQTVLYYILLIGHIESNPGPNIVSSKPNLKNGSLKIAHINACSLLPKIDLIELEMSNNDIILVSETLISLRLRFRRNFLSVLHLNLVSSPIKGILEIFYLTTRCIPMDILAWTDCVRSSAGNISYIDIFSSSNLQKY